VLQRFAGEGLKGFGQLLTSLYQQELLLLHAFDGLVGLGLRDGTGSGGFGQVATKSVEFDPVCAATASQLL
jgi:hypothetical protein